MRVMRVMRAMRAMRATKATKAMKVLSSWKAFSETTSSLHEQSNKIIRMAPKMCCQLKLYGRPPFVQRQPLAILSGLG